jgi:hypothetical protein
MEKINQEGAKRKSRHYTFEHKPVAPPQHYLFFLYCILDVCREHNANHENEHKNAQKR